MLTLIGDILNWAAAGVFFPLMFLPLAALFSSARGKGSLIWLVIVAVIAGAGALFTMLVPALHAPPAQQPSIIFLGFVIVLAGFIYTSGGPKKVMQVLAPPLAFSVKSVGRLVMWFLLTMALVQFGVVVLRYVFGLNYIFMQEAVTYMHGAVFLLAAGYALISDDHVRVDIFYRDAPVRRKALIDFLGTYFLLFPISLLLVWTASPYVGGSWSVGEGSAETSGIQGVFILKSFIPAFAVLLAIAGFTIAARAVETLERG